MTREWDNTDRDAKREAEAIQRLPTNRARPRGGFALTKRFDDRLPAKTPRKKADKPKTPKKPKTPDLTLIRGLFGGLK